MPSEPRKASGRENVYWDACMFVSYFSKEYPERLAVLEHLVGLAREKKILVVTSILTRAEVIKGPRGGEIPIDDRKYLEAFFDNEWISLRATDRVVWDQTMVLRMENGLHLADAVHAATALCFGLEMETYDERHLIKRDGILRRDGEPGSKALRIRLPRFRELEIKVAEKPTPLLDLMGDDPENMGGGGRG